MVSHSSDRWSCFKVTFWLLRRQEALHYLIGSRFKNGSNMSKIAPYAQFQEMIGGSFTSKPAECKSARFGGICRTCTLARGLVSFNKRYLLLVIPQLYIPLETITMS